MARTGMGACSRCWPNRRAPSVRSCWEWLGGEFGHDAFDTAATDELLERYDRRTPQRSRR